MIFYVNLVVSTFIWERGIDFVVSLFYTDGAIG